MSEDLQSSGLWYSCGVLSSFSRVWYLHACIHQASSVLSEVIPVSYLTPTDKGHLALLGPPVAWAVMCVDLPLSTSSISPVHTPSHTLPSLAFWLLCRAAVPAFYCQHSYKIWGWLFKIVMPKNVFHTYNTNSS